MAFLLQTILTNLGAALRARLQDILSLATFGANIAHTYKVAFVKIFAHCTHSYLLVYFISTMPENTLARTSHYSSWGQEIGAFKTSSRY